jgi:hypothetical protein
MGIYTTHTRTPSYGSWLYPAINKTLKMGKESVPQKPENIHVLTRLSAQEHFIEFCRRESFKTDSRVFVTLFVVRFHPAAEERRKRPQQERQLLGLSYSFVLSIGDIYNYDRFTAMMVGRVAQSV